jgi:hypothetical protein
MDDATTVNSMPNDRFLLSHSYSKSLRAAFAE